jgi:hypothetical protein
MRKVAETLWVGNAFEARDMKGVSSAGIKAIVDLAVDESPIEPLRDLICMRIPLIDGAGNSDHLLRMAISTVSTLLATKVPTLVACSGGMSRAPVIAAAAMRHASRTSLTRQLNLIARSGPCDVSPTLLSDVLNIIGDD